MPTTTRRAAAKPAPEPEVVEDEFEDLEDEDTDETEDDVPEELEDEVEDDELEEVDETPAPKKKKAASTAIDVPEFGSAWLAEHITRTLNEKMDGRAVRMLLRKLAADGKLNRVVGESRNRYSFTGPLDPIVLAVVGMVQDGTAKAMKQEGLQRVKEKADEKRAAAKLAKEKAAAEVAGETEEMEEVDEVEEAPKPRTRRASTSTKTAPVKAAPAKAAASTTRRKTTTAK
jgi:hypothetical protein